MNSPFNYDPYSYASPSRKTTNSNVKSGYVIKHYNGEYNNNRFNPSTQISDYECVYALPNINSFFYRMDIRRGFTGTEKADNVFGIDRNTYFGLHPEDIKDKYKTHTHLYVVKPNTPIVLINMNILENIQKLMDNAPDDIKISITNAFPIEGGVVKRVSKPAYNYNDKIDHDRQVLEYICNLPNIDGYYVTAPPLHPEIGFCAKSLHKLDVVDMFFIRTDPLGEREQGISNTRKRRRRNSNSNSNNNDNNNNDNNNDNNQMTPKVFRRSLFFPSNNQDRLTLDNLEGGKRKTRRNCKSRKTQKKQRNRK